MIMAVDYSAIAQETVRILLAIKAIQIRPDQPFTLASGGTSPVYVNCRKIISYPKARNRLMEFATTLIADRFASTPFEVIAGGESAGIPFASFIAQTLDVPMCYVRKHRKGYGMNLRIEGEFAAGARVLLVEDLASDGGSKINFVNTLRDEGKAQANHCFAIFFYDIFPEARAKLAEADITMHYLATWRDVLAVGGESNSITDQQLNALKDYMDDPIAWSHKHSQT